MSYDIIYIDRNGTKYNEGDFSMCSPYVKNLILEEASGEPLNDIIKRLASTRVIKYNRGTYERVD